MVVDHLHDHPADCQNLFSSDAKQPQNDNDHPLGKDKVSVCAVIMKYVFQNDAEYVDYYVAEPEKFWDSMNSHINRLRRKYCNSYDKLHVTGTGIMPEDEAQNLHAQIMKEFPCLSFLPLALSLILPLWHSASSSPSGTKPYPPSGAEEDWEW
ncbi:hypothetical protein EDB19DRAFT_1916655 [Suillus lakei]|nr:hypothetical protein EDB19DRAFT_1916655 [Suillus lakei]